VSLLFSAIVELHAAVAAIAALDAVSALAAALAAASVADLHYFDNMFKLKTWKIFFIF